MSAVSDTLDATPKSRGPWATALRRLLRDRAAVAALILFLMVVILCLLAPAYAQWTGTDPFKSTLDAVIKLNGQDVPVMEQSTEGLGLGYTPIGPTWQIGNYFLGGQDGGMRNRKLEHELRVSAGEVDSHRAGRLVARNAAFQRAGRRCCNAGISTDDDGIETTRGGARHLEDALERSHHVLYGHIAAIRELDAVAKLEGVGLAVIAGSGKFFGEVGNNLEAGLARTLFEGREATVDRLINLPVLQCVVDLRIERARRRTRNDAHRSAAVLGFVFGLCRRQRRQGDGQGSDPGQHPLLHDVLPSLLLFLQSLAVMKSPTVFMHKTFSST